MLEVKKGMKFKVTDPDGRGSTEVKVMSDPDERGWVNIKYLECVWDLKNNSMTQRKGSKREIHVSSLK